MKNLIKNNILGFILGGLISGIIGIYATNYVASDISTYSDGKFSYTLIP